MGSGKFLGLVARVHSIRRVAKLHELNQLQQEEVHMNHEAGSEEPGFSGRGCGHDEPFRRFEADLAVRLQQLQLGGRGGSAHLNWLLDACASTLSTHSSLAPLLSSTTLRPAPDQRADEVLSLLDLCTSLRCMADDVDRQLSFLQRALRPAEQALRTRHTMSAAKLHSAARRLQGSLHGLQLLDSKQYKPLAEAHAALFLAAKRVVQVSDPAAPPLSNALDGTLLISLLLLASTLSSFAAPTTNNRSTATRSACAKVIARYVSTCRKWRGTEAAWVGHLGQLQRDVKREEMSCVFLELQRLQASASSLRDALYTAANSDCTGMNAGDLRLSVDSLRKNSKEAQACISTLRSHLASLFQAFLALRLALLPTSAHN